MRLRLLVAALSVLGSPLCAQHFLEPRDTSLEQYDQRLRGVLHEAFDADVKARVLVMHSFQPEWVTGLRRMGENWEVFTVRPQKQIWLYEIVDMMKAGRIQTLGPDAEKHQSEEIRELEASLPPSAGQVRLTRCAATLDAEQASKITAVWRHMLSETREPDGIGLDGITYYFSMPTDCGEMSAKAWSPSAESRVGRLVSLASEMDAYCQSEDPKHLRKMSALANKILKDD